MSETQGIDLGEEQLLFKKVTKRDCNGCRHMVVCVVQHSLWTLFHNLYISNHQKRPFNRADVATICDCFEKV